MSAGYVYAMANESMPGLVKFGITTNLERRQRELSASTSVPVPFEVVASVRCRDAAAVERRLFSEISDYHEGKEFYRVVAPKHAAAALLCALGTERPVCVIDLIGMSVRHPNLDPDLDYLIRRFFPEDAAP